MNLSLFKGINRETLSLFLEKTHLHFRNFSCGEVVIYPEEECDFVRCMIKGEAKVSHFSEDGSHGISEIVGEGRFFGIDRLFGLDRCYCMTVSAVTDMSLIEFSKKQYVDFIRKNDVLFINYLNALSLECQKMKKSVINAYGGTWHDDVVRLLAAFTGRDGRDICIYLPEDMIEEMKCQVSQKSDGMVTDAIEKGVLKIDGNVIRIPDKSQFMNWVAKIQ